MKCLSKVHFTCMQQTSSSCMEIGVGKKLHSAGGTSGYNLYIPKYSKSSGYTLFVGSTNFKGKTCANDFVDFVKLAENSQNSVYVIYGCVNIG